jgi:ankyrin repeat protein
MFKRLYLCALIITCFIRQNHLQASQINISRQDLQSELVKNMIHEAHGGSLDESKLRNYLEQGIHIDGRDNCETTALINAALGNRIDVVNLLLNYGAHINLQNIFGKSAFSYAVHNKNNDMIKSGSSLQSFYSDIDSAGSKS